MVVGVIYRRPNTNIKDFLDRFDDSMLTLQNERKIIYISGDFNLDLLRWEENSAVADFMNICHSKLFFNTINKPTRVTATSATLIDHIWSNDINGIVDNGIIYSKVSDHFPVFSIFELRGDKSSTTLTTIKRKELLR